MLGTATPGALCMWAHGLDLHCGDFLFTVMSADCHPSLSYSLTKWNFHFLVCKWVSPLCFCLIFIYSVYMTGTMHINQHLSFHITVNVSDPFLPPPPPPPPLPPALLSFPHSAVASAQLQSANQHRNSNEWNCLWGESVSDGGPDD